MTRRTPPLMLALAIASGLSGCAGDLDDPDQYADITANPVIRTPNFDPRTMTPAPSTSGGGAGAGSGGGAGMLPQGCARAPEAIFGDVAVCGSSSCHGSPGEPPALDVVDLGNDTQNLFARLVTEQGVISCPGTPIIDTTNPTMSLLLTKLNPTPPCGAPMPFGGGAMISEAERQCLTNWVVAEAAALTP